MSSRTVKNMWGQDFRVVRDGLAETDVVLFVEGLLNREKEGLDKLQHVDALHELARRTVEDAEKIALAARDEGLRLSEEQAGRIVATAQQQAQDVVAQAAKSAQDRAEQLVEGIVEVAAAPVASLEASLSERVEQRIMRVEQAFRTWLGSVRPLVAVWNIEQFNKLVVEAESLLTMDDPAGTASEEEDPSRQATPGAR